MNDIIVNKVNKIYEKVVDYRRYLHQNPELSFKEFNTTRFIISKLQQLNINFYQPTETGVVAIIGNGDNCVALRADIDALPIKEETELPFSSYNEGVMHACGHDMHTAMLLGVTEILNDLKHEYNGCIKVIFQPGEEKLPGGASVLIKAGVLENPKPLAIFGQHIYPDEKEGVIALNSGPFFASADEIYWTIVGKSGHAAQPQLSNDAILASSHLINFYQTMITKFKNPLNPGVLSVTSINGGSATNIFPDKVKMMGTLRSFDENWRLEMHNLIVEKSKSLVGLYNCDCDVEIIKGYPPLVNNKLLTDFISGNAEEILGKHNVNIVEPKMFAEDFAYYAQRVPAVFWFLGVKPNNVNQMPPLHSSNLNPSEIAMKNGMILLAKSAIDFINLNT